MRIVIFAAIAVLLSGTTFAAEPPTTEEQKTLYAVGLSMARTLSVFNLSKTELEMVQLGVNDGVTGNKPAIELEAYSAKVQALANQRRTAQGEKLAGMAKEYIEKAAAEKGAVKTASGLIYLATQEGTGAKPAATDKVKVNYRGTLVDGQEFDSSYKRGQPAEFPLNNVIKCWTEGVQMMKVGGKAKLVCPSEIAYGERGAGAVVPPNATLVFEVELLDAQQAPPPAPVPAPTATPAPAAKAAPAPAAAPTPKP